MRCAFFVCISLPPAPTLKGGEDGCYALGLGVVS